FMSTSIVYVVVVHRRRSSGSVSRLPGRDAYGVGDDEEEGRDIRPRAHRCIDERDPIVSAQPVEDKCHDGKAEHATEPHEGEPPRPTSAAPQAERRSSTLGQSGRRFSRKALMPSWASPAWAFVVMTERIRS